MKLHKRLLIIFLFFYVVAEVQGQTSYSYRKYNHIKKFYQEIAKETTSICLENNIPPAAVLAIAGLESGWGKGYIGQISGNILSLGPRRGDKQLPALRLPKKIKNNQIIFDSLVIAKYPKHKVKWVRRPKSLKKDYRPNSIAGTPFQLAYFKYHPKEKEQARMQNIEDFATLFISYSSGISAYRKARKKMDDLVETHGKEILLEEKTSKDFIREIGGKPNSFNYRATWPRKVMFILRKVGLSDICQQLYQGESFEEAWK